MKIAMIGLGKMGANMTQRLIEHGHEVVAFDLSDQARSRGGRLGCRPGGDARRGCGQVVGPSGGLGDGAGR